MSDIIDTIVAGGRFSETVEIYYTNSDGRTISTETEPYEIRNGIYICWCNLRKKLVEIPLKNVIDAVLTGKEYSPRFEVRLDDEFGDFEAD